MASSLDSFGRLTRRTRSVRDARPVLSGVATAAPGSLLPFGNGRSYGDTCLNDSGTLADFRFVDRIFAFDPVTGILEGDAGVPLHAIIDAVARYGWFLPVTPGTRFVTLGGAVASDVHGKNHHRRGTFGCHVLGLELVRSDSGPQWLSAGDGSGLFRATIGGLGLTGFITRVRIRLMKVASLDIAEEALPFERLDTYFNRAEEADWRNEYAVAWLDQLSSGDNTRGVLLTGNHAGNGRYETGRHKPRLSVPFDLPFNALNPLVLKAFNTAYYFAKKHRADKETVSGYSGFFYPFDAVGNWNRLYGPRGLFQHQSVLPFETARKAVPALLAASREAGEASVLTMLKRFGEISSPGLMSFPMPGYTLTLDFPNRGESTLAMLEELDRITIAAGGRVNPYKDARMSAATFNASFPQWRALEQLRDPAICSDFWRRTALSVEKGSGADNSNDRFQPALTAAN